MLAGTLSDSSALITSWNVWKIVVEGNIKNLHGWSCRLQFKHDVRHWIKNEKFPKSQRDENKWLCNIRRTAVEITNLNWHRNVLRLWLFLRKSIFLVWESRKKKQTEKLCLSPTSRCFLRIKFSWSERRSWEMCWTGRGGKGEVIKRRFVNKRSERGKMSRIQLELEISSPFCFPFQSHTLNQTRPSTPSVNNKICFPFQLFNIVL